MNTQRSPGYTRSTVSRSDMPAVLGMWMKMVFWSASPGRARLFSLAPIRRHGDRARWTVAIAGACSAALASGLVRSSATSEGRGQHHGPRTGHQAGGDHHTARSRRRNGSSGCSGAGPRRARRHRLVRGECSGGPAVLLALGGDADAVLQTDWVDPAAKTVRFGDPIVSAGAG